MLLKDHTLCSLVTMLLKDRTLYSFIAMLLSDNEWVEGKEPDNKEGGGERKNH